MSAISIKKREIIEQQLNLALKLFFDDQDLLCVITLAGAAEEILGKTISNSGRKPSLERNYWEFNLFQKHLRDLGVTETIKKEYISKENEARNHMKHQMGCDEVTIDVKQEAKMLLKRALDNYKLLYKTNHKLQAEFTKFE